MNEYFKELQDKCYPYLRRETFTEYQSLVTREGNESWPKWTKCLRKATGLDMPITGWPGIVKV